jgi:hypothetical protein
MRSRNNDLLEEIGFERLTEWEVRSEFIKPVSTSWDTCAGWLYAYVVSTKVMYIGIATTVLRSRLDGYSYQINHKVGRLTRSELDKGGEVLIYGVRRPGIPGTDLEVEESCLIARFNPPWNVRR